MSNLVQISKVLIITGLTAALWALFVIGSGLWVFLISEAALPFAMQLLFVGLPVGLCGVMVADLTGSLFVKLHHVIRGTD